MKDLLFFVKMEILKLIIMKAIHNRIFILIMIIKIKNILHGKNVIMKIIKELNIIKRMDVLI